jgi:hypothetical protein
MPNFDMVE